MSQTALQLVFKVWVDGHGRRPGTFQGWKPSSHWGQSVQVVNECQVHCTDLECEY